MYEALVSSAIDSARLAESMGMDGSQIILSCKVSGVQDLISVYRELAKREPDRVVLMDGSQSASEIEHQIWEALSDRFPVFAAAEKSEIGNRKSKI